MPQAMNTPITLETLNTFLQAAAWWERCRKPLNRYAYRAVRELAELKAEQALSGKTKSWTQKEAARK